MTIRERMSGVDTAWLRMDKPTNLMMIVGCLQFEQAVSLAAVRKVVRERLVAHYPRFGDAAEQDALGAYWRRVDRFAVNQHVLAVGGAARGEDELKALVSELASKPLPAGRPLWQFDLVKLKKGSALIVRIHHCYADGIALIQVMLSLTGGTAGESLATPDAPAARLSTAPNWLGPMAGAVGQLQGSFMQALQMAQQVAGQGLGAVAHPQQAIQDAGALAIAASGKALEIGREVAALATMGPDGGALKGELGVAKRCVWSAPLPLAEVKAIGKAMNASINDVLVAMAAAALRRYVLARHDSAESLRAVIPVNLRGGAPAESLGNQFGLVFLDLPVDNDHPVERVFEVKRRMVQLKKSHQPVLAFALLQLVGMGPVALQEQVNTLLSQSASTVLTNVPGPTTPRYFAGAAISRQNFWVPQSGNIGMGLSILSYNGQVEFGVMADAAIAPDPQAIADYFVAEYERLMWLTLMSPWGDEWDKEMA